MADHQDIFAVEGVEGVSQRLQPTNIDDMAVAQGDGVGIVGGGMDVGNFVQDIYLTTSETQKSTPVGYSVVGPSDGANGAAQGDVTRQAFGADDVAGVDGESSSAESEEMIGTLEDAAVQIAYKSVMVHVAWGMALRMSKDITSLVKGG